MITGLNRPVALAITGNSLFVADRSGGTIQEYNLTTGAAINPSFVTGLTGPLYLAVSGDSLFETDIDGNAVGKFSVSGGGGNPSFITGLTEPAGLAVLGDDLFVTSYYAGKVGEYNASTGAAIDPNFIAGQGHNAANLDGVAIPEPVDFPVIIGGLAGLAAVWRRFRRGLTPSVGAPRA